MNALRSILKSNFFIKLTNWEYWPFGFVQAPLFIYYPWLSLRAGSFFFFSASNPAILMGGMFGESKFDVLEKVPPDVRPKTILISLPATAAEVVARMAQAEISYPAIFKPDLGERGWMVRRIDGPADVVQYLSEIRISFLVQEFVDLPQEYGVFYIRYPESAHGTVSSIVVKEMLFVTGDGRRSLEMLILDNERARLQWEILKIKFARRLTETPEKGVRIELVSIGNHCLGTKFINGNSLITEKLSSAFDRISRRIDGFYFGRFDLKAASVEDLERGLVKIVELNGCGAEPAHIYDPAFSLLQAMRVMIRHWRDIYLISVQNHARGTPYISFREGKAIFRKFRALKG